MPNTVQVTPGESSVARFGEVVAWFETDSRGGGVMVTQVLQILRSVAYGAVAHHELGSRIAALLTTGEVGAVPALVAAVPVEGGLQVVVHGWGAVVADGLRIPNGWVDEVVPGRETWWIGRNTATPLAPVVGSPIALQEGLVPGIGAGIALEARSAAPVVEAPVLEAPVLEAPAAESVFAPTADAEPPADGVDAGESSALLQLDDGTTLEITTGFVVGSAPESSRAVRQGLLQPLVLTDAGGTVRPVHAEVRMEDGRVMLVDATGGATHVLPPGATDWQLVQQGRAVEVEVGTRVAIGTRVIYFPER